jgi:hypothetical protein
LAVTEPAVALNFAVVEPAATVTDDGVVSAELLSETVTVKPLLGAAADRVTVQVELEPEAMLVGEHCKPEMLVAGGGGVTVTAAVAELPLRDAVIMTD